MVCGDVVWGGGGEGASQVVEIWCRRLRPAALAWANGQGILRSKLLDEVGPFLSCILVAASRVPGSLQEACVSAPARCVYGAHGCALLGKRTAMTVDQDYGQHEEGVPPPFPRMPGHWTLLRGVL